MRRCPLPAVLLLLLAAGRLPTAEPASRVPLPGESAATGRRLDAADQLAADKQYAAAADEYVHLIDEAGDDLVAIGDHLCLPVRHLCQLRLAALPPEFLRPYRTRIDPQAKKWVAQGVADHDVRVLERLVDEAFCSRPAEAALDALGDLAFERDHFHEAERWWRKLAEPASEAARRLKEPLPSPWSKPRDQPPSLELLFPDPQMAAQARAKQILAQLFRGERAAAAEELDAFRTLHPKVEGHLAGREGNYADILKVLASRPIPAEPAEDAWLTFAGSPSRSAVLPAEPADPNRLNPLVKDGPAWRFQVDQRRVVTGEWIRPPRPDTKPAAEPLSAAERARHLPFHPVIVGRQVLVADARSVTAFDTASGSSATWDLAERGQVHINEANGLRLKTQLPAPADLRYTLTVADGRIYARLGVQELAPAKAGPESDSFLVCLQLTEPAPRLKTLWLRKADPMGKGSPWMFEGAPVVRDGLLHVAATRFDGAQMTTEIRCYSADSDAPPRWSQPVVATRDFPSTPRYRHQLLTLAGRHVVYASHAGAVIALDARTGRRAWAYRYPSANVTTPGGNPGPRDLAPAVYAEGHLYVAPNDYDRLLCLDPETGQLLWERERIEIVHLLGVGSGRLVFTTPRGIRAVHAADGDDSEGWQVTGGSDYPGLPSNGRGFLAGDLVFWPTSSGIKVLRQSDGLPPIDLIPGPLELHTRPGNLVYSNGLFIIADKFGLIIYGAPRTRSGNGKDSTPQVPGHTLDGPLRQVALALADGAVRINPDLPTQESVAAGARTPNAERRTLGGAEGAQRARRGSAIRR
jgi:outer membrane protein assembly factor BamB